MEINEHQSTTNVVIPENIEQIMEAYLSREAEKLPPGCYTSCHIYDGEIRFVASSWSGGPTPQCADSLPEAVAKFVAKLEASKKFRIAQLRRELAEAEAEEPQPLPLPEEVAAS